MVRHLAALDLGRDELLGLKASEVRPTTEAPEGWSDLLPPDIEMLDPLDALIGGPGYTASVLYPGYRRPV